MKFKEVKLVLVYILSDEEVYSMKGSASMPERFICVEPSSS